MDDRLSETSKYTGSYKERFDESGKGKGLSGREWDKSTREGMIVFRLSTFHFSPSHFQ